MTFRSTLGTAAQRDPTMKGNLMLAITLVSLFALGCTNDVPADAAPDVTSSPSGAHHDDSAPAAEPDDTGSDTTTEPEQVIDEDGDGFAIDEDCDDQDPRIHPHAVELCDGLDNDCDGLTDPASAEGGTVWYQDADGDGFGGTTERVACQAPGEDWTAVGMDCDDTDPGIHPHAEEVCDGIDSNCDGAEGEGLAAWYSGGGATAEDVTDLMDSGVFHRLEYGTLKLCEGTFETQFEFEVSGMSMTLAPKVVVEGIGRVQIDGRGESRLFEIGDDVGTLELVNLRLMNGDAERGGAILADHLDLVLEEVKFTDNHADGAGGAVYIEDGSIELIGVDFLRNISDGYSAHGGAIYLGVGEVSGVDVVMQGNEARGMASGGAIFIEEGSIHLEDASITSNTAGYKGGAIVTFDGDVSLVDSSLDRNSALAGGGVYVVGDLDLLSARLEENQADTGGAVYLGDRDGWQTMSCRDGGGLLANEGTVEGAAVFVESPFGTTIDSDSCDWGTGSADNGSGVDIDTPLSAISAADDATFTCVNYTCSGEVSVAYGTE